MIGCVKRATKTLYIPRTQCKHNSTHIYIVIQRNRKNCVAPQQTEDTRKTSDSKNCFEHYKILKSFIKNVIPTNKYIHNQTLKFNLKINGKSKY